LIYAPYSTYILCPSFHHLPCIGEINTPEHHCRHRCNGLEHARRRGVRGLIGVELDQLVEPVVENKCDMSRGFYRRAEYDGAVTKLVAKPMSWVFFPEIAHFNQPLSGEICATAGLFKEVINQRDCPEGWGIDIWILIETAMRDFRIKEIYLGTKVHTSRQDYFDDVVRLAKMAEQVNLTAIKEAIKYKRIDNVKKVSL